jgi:hypothetical protein
MTALQNIIWFIKNFFLNRNNHKHLGEFLKIVAEDWYEETKINKSWYPLVLPAGVAFVYCCLLALVIILKYIINLNDIKWILLIVSAGFLFLCIFIYKTFIKLLPSILPIKMSMAVSLLFPIFLIITPVGNYIYDISINLYKSTMRIAHLPIYTSDWVYGTLKYIAIGVIFAIPYSSPLKSFFKEIKRERVRHRPIDMKLLGLNNDENIKRMENFRGLKPYFDIIKYKIINFHPIKGFKPSSPVIESVKKYQEEQIVAGNNANKSITEKRLKSYMFSTKSNLKKTDRKKKKNRIRQQKISRRKYRNR